MSSHAFRRFFGLVVLALLPVLTPSSPTRANELIEEGSLDSDAQAWSMIVVQGKISDSFRGYLEIQPRWSSDAESFDKFIVRPAAVYTLNDELTLWVGYAGIQSFVPSGSWEHRTWQQIQHDKNFGGFILINRTRFEQRFLPGAADTSHRFRHMVRGLLPVNDDKTWAVVFSDEVFVNLNDADVGGGSTIGAGFDQNRAFVGLNHALNSQLRIEFGYLNNFINRPAGQADRLNHNFLLALFFNF
jgi:hypothetical protein